jgi:hypothetical protein
MKKIVFFTGFLLVIFSGLVYAKGNSSVSLFIDSNLIAPKMTFEEDFGLPSTQNNKTAMGIGTGYFYSINEMFRIGFDFSYMYDGSTTKITDQDGEYEKVRFKTDMKTMTHFEYSFFATNYHNLFLTTGFGVDEIRLKSEPSNGEYNNKTKSRYIYSIGLGYGYVFDETIDLFVKVSYFASPNKNINFDGMIVQLKQNTVNLKLGIAYKL